MPVVAHVINPRKFRKKAKPKPAKRRKANPLDAIVLGLGNPRRSHMAKTKKKRNRKNPSVGGHRKKSHSSALARFQRRRNPLLPEGETATSVALLGASAGGGAILSSWIPDRFFKNWDQGFVGYLMNLAVAVLGSMAIGRFSKKAGLGFLVGGVAVTIGRVWDDKTGQNVIAVNVPGVPGMSSFFTPGSWPLPAAGPYGAQPTLMLPAAAPALPAVAAAQHQGMGWNARLAA